MNRILIDTHTFKHLLDQHPNIGVELMHGVPEKIAEELNRKVAKKLAASDATAEKIVAKISKQLASNYGLPPVVKDLIRAEAREQLKDIVATGLRKEIEIATQDMLKGYLTARLAEMDKKVDQNFATRMGEIDLKVAEAIDRQVVTRVTTAMKALSA